MTELAPNCYVCRMAIRHAKDRVDNLLIVGLVMGYATAKTEGEIEWTGNDLCDHHASQFQRAKRAVERRLTSPKESDGK